MASRRDELNAYTYAKKRLVAQFLQPSPTGTEEGAPRPLRAVVPGLIIGVVIMAGFGAWGLFKPKAPKDWDEAGQHVIIGSESTTRYVVLNSPGKKQPELHPVLNFASAKLLLDPDKGDIVKVDEKVLDGGKLPHGATIGIPYAPDRLPDPGEAGGVKRWAVCERPGQGGSAIQKAAFVFAKRDMSKVEGQSRLRGGQLMYVQGPGPDKQQYVVDGTGKAYEVKKGEKLQRTLVGPEEPQHVSSQWLKTLHKGESIGFPEVEGTPGDRAHVPGLDPESDKVGMVLRATSGATSQQYVVLPGRVMPISDFMAKLLLNSPKEVSLGQNGKPRPISASEFSPSKKRFGYGYDWPEQAPERVNSASSRKGSRNTSCSVLRHVSGKNTTTLSTWSGTRFPAKLAAGSTSGYVTPGSGQLYRQVQGKDTKVGGVFLVTDTGLRYAMQSNSDSERGGSGVGAGGKEQKRQQRESKQAQTRLGYGDMRPAPVPAEWSQFLPTGPRLSTGSARQPQGS
jgi:type VII secretion protein EccB